MLRYPAKWLAASGIAFPGDVWRGIAFLGDVGPKARQEPSRLHGQLRLKHFYHGLLAVAAVGCTLIGCAHTSRQVVTPAAASDDPWLHQFASIRRQWNLLPFTLLAGELPGDSVLTDHNHVVRLAMTVPLERETMLACFEKTLRVDLFHVPAGQRMVKVDVELPAVSPGASNRGMPWIEMKVEGRAALLRPHGVIIRSSTGYIFEYDAETEMEPARAAQLDAMHVWPCSITYLFMVAASDDAKSLELRASLPPV